MPGSGVWQVENRENASTLFARTLIWDGRTDVREPMEVKMTRQPRASPRATSVTSQLAVRRIKNHHRLSGANLIRL